MEALLTLKNVGGFRGVREFRLAKGKVNLVDGSNAAGKSSVIRALAAVLAGRLSHDEFIREAGNLGLLGDSLRNIYERDAQVMLDCSPEQYMWSVDDSGTLGGTQGDERFLLTSVLTQEARVIRQLVMGDPDFSWVGRLLSWASRYQAARDEVESAIHNADQQILAMTKRYQTLADTDMKFRATSDLKNQFEEERSRLAARLDQEKRRLIEQIQEVDREIEGAAVRREEQEAALLHYEQDLKVIQAKRKETDLSVTHAKKEIESISLDEIRREVRGNVSALDEKAGVLRNEIAGLSSVRSTLTDAKAILTRDGESEGICPICETSKITSGFLDQRIEALSHAIGENERKLHGLMAERTRELQREALAVNKINGLNQAIRGAEGNLRDLNLKENTARASIGRIAAVLPSLREQQLELQGRKEELSRSTQQWEAELHESLRSLEAKIQAAANDLSSQRRRINELSSVDIDGTRVTHLQAERLWTLVKHELAKWSEYLDERRHEHEVGALVRFNSMVKKVVADIGFRDFDQIAIDTADQQLKVFRDGFVRQPLDSLSTSERYSVALVLQIALRETYLPSVPFFLIDELMVSYDLSRTARILQYLTDMAATKALFLVISSLSNAQEAGVTVATGS